MGVKDLLVTYIDRIGETDAVDSIAEVDGVEAAVRATAIVVRDAMQGGQDPFAFSSALTWVRDGSLGLGSVAVMAGVRACVPRLLTPTLGDALLAPVYAVRSQVIYTLGKMTFREHLPLLQDVFQRYVDRDPLLAPKLIGEIAWLGGDDALLVAQVCAHPHHLTRWSFFGTAAARGIRIGGSENEQVIENEPLRALCAELSADPAVVVSAEARYILDELSMLAAIAREGLTDRTSRRERKRRRAELEASAPLRFDTMSLRFLNALDGTDYDVDTLDSFVRSLTVSS